MKIISSIFIISFFSLLNSQDLVKNEIITERHPNGLKKLINVFEGDWD
jgi:hypothetical protein